MSHIKHEIKETHITDIKAGDTVEHRGHLKTVCNCNIAKDAFLGATLFGDSYRGGRELVKKAIIFRAMPNLAVA